MWPFNKRTTRVYKKEKVMCSHCMGTGKCTCGIPIVSGMKFETRERSSIKDLFGIEHLCLGVCAVCGGKGHLIVETYEDVLLK